MLCVKASDLLWAQWRVPACAAAAAVVPVQGTVVVAKCQWASALWTVIKCLCPKVFPPKHGLPVGSTVKDGKCLKYCKGLKYQIFDSLAAGLNSTSTRVPVLHLHVSPPCLCQLYLGGSASHLFLQTFSHVNEELVCTRRAARPCLHRS